MQEAEIRGLRVAFERLGSGPPLVLLHGILQDSRAWKAQLPEFSRHFDVVAWDTPGCGQSSDPPETFRLPDFAACLAGLLDALAIPSAHVLGLSWGGGLAIEFAGRYPGLTKSLVLTGAYAGWAGSLPRQLVDERLGQVEREAEMPARDFVPNWLPGLLTEAAPPEMRAEVIAMMSDFHPVGYRTMGRAFAEADLRDVLPRVQAPALLLYGELDRRSPLSVAEDLNARLPNSRLVVLNDAGHLSNIEAADAFNLEVLSFLN